MSVADFNTIHEQVQPDPLHLLVNCNCLFGPHEQLCSVLDQGAKLIVESLPVEQCTIIWAGDGNNGAHETSEYSRNGAEMKIDQLPAFRQLLHKAQTTRWPGTEHLQVFDADYGRRRLLVTALRVRGEVVGTCAMLVNNSPDSDSPDFREILSLLMQQIDHAIESFHLKKLLASRYAAFAISRDGKEKNDSAHSIAEYTLAAVKNPEKVAKLIARSFYKDLRRAGFDMKQILIVASELIDNLNQAVKRTREKTSEAS